MADRSHIQWTDATWSPVTGCTRTSEGCLRCYIDRTPPLRITHRRFDGPDIGATTGVQLHSERLGTPLRWRKPRRIFVCSLADLFHDQVPDRFIADVFAVMAIAVQHTFQILTKRHARLRSLLGSASFWATVNAACVVRGYPPLPAGTDHLPNAWVGVSVENQKWADLRVPVLLDTPARVRFLSLEPLLAPVDLQRAVVPMGDQRGHGLTASWVHTRGCCQRRLHGIDWVIIGGESGPGARPMDLAWASDLVGQARQAGTAVFVKQLGAVWAHRTGVHRGDPKGDHWDGWPAPLRIRDYPTTAARKADHR
jgi:protein gp37